MLEGFTQVKQVGHVKKAGVEFQWKVEFAKKKEYLNTLTQDLGMTKAAACNQLQMRGT